MFFLAGHSHEHQAQDLKWFGVDANQASEQDQLSTIDIHQEDQIDDHWVIEIIELHQV
jgi:hypothetical protein